MKKTLFLSLFFLFNIVVSALAADLNPYAYGLQSQSTDAENFKVTLQYSLNAPATSVKIYAKDGKGTSYLLKNCGARTKGLHSEEIDLMAAMDKGVPPGEELSWYVDVACNRRSATEPCGRKINFQSPFSIDIDNNPHSPYFGRIVTTQANNNSTRGIRAYNPDFTQIGGNYIGSIVKFPSGNWYTYTHVTPFRIRVLQDGTGKIFVSSADVGQSTYMWQVNPANLNDWSVFLKSADMITLTGHPDEDDSMANHNFDFRKKSNGEWELLLLSSSINEKNKELASGYAHSGIYTLNADLSKKSYTEYITNKQGAPHAVVDDEFIASVVSGNAQFDPNGNILYSSFQLSHDPDGSALIHHQVQKNAFANEYHSFERLKRRNTASGGMRYSGDFTKLAVAAGNQTKEVSICSVSHTQGYMTISSLESVDMISASHSTSAYIVDFAWDYASNLYACVRNSSETDLRGVWVMALNLDGKAISTPAREEYNFSIPCNPNQQCTVTCNATTGGRIVNGYSGGTQYACTQMTVKAEPNDNNYRFEKWTDQTGKTVSTNAEYTFYVYKDVQLTAHFIGAVFNVTWWNLFQNGEDIAKESSTTPDSNERLWRLYQVFFNQYCTSTVNSVSRKDKAWVKVENSSNYHKEFDVAGFFSSSVSSNQITRNAANEKYLMATVALRENESTDATTPFVWLRKYIEYINNNVEINSAISTPSASLGNRWGYALYCFFNRTNVSMNASGNSTTNYIGLNANHKSFVTYGKPENWRPWWTEGACDLPRTYNYSTPMPTSWKQINVTCQNYSITTDAACPSSYKIEDVPITSWYKWNTAPKANQLLAWRNGGTDYKKYPIVHHVDDDMALYATYVDKHLQEDDPDPSGQYDAKNSDVLSLLANDNYGSTVHDVKIDRKFTGGMYNTVCFPFDLPVSKLPSELSNADIRVFNGVAETYTESGDPVAVLNFITLQEYWQDKTSYLGESYLQAGVPYLIKPNADVNAEYLIYSLKQSLFFDGTQMPYNKTFDGVTFQGVFNPTTLSPGDCILVADNRLAKVTNTSEKLKGFRGYFKIEDAYLQTLAAKGKLYLSMRKPATTSIPVAPDAEKQDVPKAQKIMRNGKIYILRDGKTYSITGARVE